MTAAADLKRLASGAVWKTEKLDRGVDHLPPELLMGALPADKLQQSILLAKYALANRHDAYFYCRNQFTSVILKRKWDIPPGVEIYRAICRLAVDDVVDEPLCRKCKGRGEHWPHANKPSITCDLCEGSGHKSHTEGMRYRLVKAMPYQGLRHVTEDDWRKKWKHRAYDAFVMAQNAHNEGVNYVYTQLEGDDD